MPAGNRDTCAIRVGFGRAYLAYDADVGDGLAAVVRDIVVVDEPERVGAGDSLFVVAFVAAPDALAKTPHLVGV